jgi:hypothetical protein
VLRKRAEPTIDAGKMASSAPFQFAGESDSEDDNFNPAPADASDDENDAPRAASIADRRASSPAADNDEDDEDEDEDPLPGDENHERQGFLPKGSKDPRVNGYGTIR